MFGKILACRDTIPAVVQAARQKNTNRNLAIKKYSIDKLPLAEEGEDSAKYIQHEVSSMKLFLHPNLLHCLAAFVVKQEVWIVSPLMSFGSVKDLISSHFHEGLPELACAFILRDVLLGLQYLHFQGVVHRSLRASHVLVSDTGSAILSGFRYCTGLHATGENRTNLYDYPLHGVGSNLAWLAPEILQQNLLGYNETSDIYSLGVTACEMANGITPYSNLPPTLMLIEKLKGAAPRLMDASTLSPPTPGQEEDMVGFPGHPADSGVGESVGSCNLVGKDSSYFTREFSGLFHNFVKECTGLLSNERPSAHELLGHGFIKQLKKSASSLLNHLQGAPQLAVDTLGNQDDEHLLEKMESLGVEDMSLDTWDFN